MSSVINIKSVMSVKELCCEFHMPKEIQSRIGSYGEELVNPLPPYDLQPVYPVDEFPACPSNWMNGSDIASSYFVKVQEGRGMWLNLNGNFNHTHDVAMVVSIQGINPITGLPTIGSKTLRLEQYRNKCPIHNVDFQQDYFCPECKFKWPGQNYLATTGTPFGFLWIDGFRAPDGKVRQYIITADEKKGIAAQLIGDERVFAIGIAYYLSKNKKPEAPIEVSRVSDPTKGGLCIPDSAKYGASISYKPYIPSKHGTSSLSHSGATNSNSSQGGWRSAKGKRYGASGQSAGGQSYTAGDAQNSTPMFFSPLHTPQGWDAGGICGANLNASADINSTFSLCCASGDVGDVQTVQPVKSLEIGAGALINQIVYTDPKSIDYWEDTPAGMIYINYCDEETFKKIVQAGKREESEEGFMTGLKKGN
jgi:hypothetical protein